MTTTFVAILCLNTNPGEQLQGMRLFVRTLQGKLNLFEVEEQDLVWHVLALVPPGGLPPDYAVTFHGHRLDFNRTLSSYKIKEDDVLHAIGAPRVRSSQQRRRRDRQMVDAILVHQEMQEIQTRKESAEADPAADETLESQAAAAAAAEATKSTPVMARPASARRFRKRKVSS